MNYGCGSMFPTFVHNTWTSTPMPPDYIVHEVGMCAAPRACLPERPSSLSRLFALLDENGEDDYGKIGPSQYAYKTSYDLVGQAERIAGEELLSSSSVDSEGGIRVTWRRGDRQVKLICPAASDAPVYIYHSSPRTSQVRNQNVSASVLAETLS